MQSLVTSVCVFLIAISHFSAALPLGPNKVTCEAKGDPHIKTFDGTTYDFSGHCTYDMVRDVNPHNAGSTFGVTVDNMYRRGEKNARVVGFSIRSNGNVVHVTGKEDGTFTLRDENGAEIQQTGYPLTHGGITIKEEGTSLAFETDVGVHLLWNKFFRVVISLDLDVVDDARYVEGMCGDVNGDDANDLKSRQGAPVDFNQPKKSEQQIIDEFGDTWAVPNTCVTI